MIAVHRLVLHAEGHTQERADLVAVLLAKRPEDRPDAAAAAAALAMLLPELEGAAAPGQFPAAPAITGGEQRLACVLLMHPLPESVPAAPDPRAPDAIEVSATTLPENAPRATILPERDTLVWLRALVGPGGGRADGLADGGLVVSWLGPGVPRDQAARAARAALMIQRRLPGAALALASGMTDARCALPLGPALDRAAALLSAGGAAEPLADAVPIDEVTAGLLDARFAIATSGGCLRLVAERLPDEEEARVLLGRATPCVGRDRELRSLVALFDECIEEPVARVLLVTAPSGMGKSRLRQEFLRRVRRESAADGEIEVWSVGAEEMGAGSPFALLRAALHRAAGVGPGDPIEQRRSALQRRIDRHVPEADRARVAIFLGEMAAAPFPASASPALAAARRDPAIMVEQIRRAWLDWIAAEMAAHPLLILLEDAQWGDAPSLQLVDAALAAHPDRPLMVLAFARRAGNPGTPSREPLRW